jgi:hypothetical protein
VSCPREVMSSAKLYCSKRRELVNKLSNESWRICRSKLLDAYDSIIELLLILYGLVESPVVAILSYQAPSITL